MKKILIIIVSVLASFVPVLLLVLPSQITNSYVGSPILNRGISLYYLYLPFLFSGLVATILAYKYNLKIFMTIIITSQIIGFILQKISDPEDHTLEFFAPVFIILTLFGFIFKTLRDKKLS